jgi:hypothetical protein
MGTTKFKMILMFLMFNFTQLLVQSINLEPCYLKDFVFDEEKNVMKKTDTDGIDIEVDLEHMAAYKNNVAQIWNVVKTDKNNKIVPLTEEDVNKCRDSNKEAACNILVSFQEARMCHLEDFVFYKEKNVMTMMDIDKVEIKVSLTNMKAYKYNSEQNVFQNLEFVQNR